MSIINKESRFAALRSQIQEITSPKGSTNNTNYKKQPDARYWKLDVDKAGSGSAVIRFLWPPAGNVFPYVKFWHHGFQDEAETKKWFINDCPSTLGGIPSDVCPACKDNHRLYSVDKLPLKDSPAKQLASSRKRKLSYISNILVINDPKHPENNGKVFLFKYGAKIFGKITDMIKPPPEFADMQPIDPFDMEEGANFRLRQVMQDGFPNYDKSTFDAPASIGDADFHALIESKLYDLNPEIDAKLFKSYEKLAENFSRTAGYAAFDGNSGATTNAGGDSTASTPSLEDGMGDDAPVAKPAAARTAAPKSTGKTSQSKTEAVAALPTEDEDYFARLAAQSANED